MTNKFEIEHAYYRTNRFVPNGEGWEKIAAVVTQLWKEELHLEAGDNENPQPVLGDIFDDGTVITAYNSLKDAFLAPEATVELLTDSTTQDVFGYTLAFPYARFNPQFQNRAGQKAAYIYATVLRKDKQGQGLVQHLIDPLLIDLSEQGYTIAVRDAMIENGYAEKIRKRFSGSIRTSYRHNKYGVGGQEYFEINIPAYLKKIHSQLQK